MISTSPDSCEPADLLALLTTLPLADSKDTVYSLGMTSLADQIAHKRNKALALEHMASLVPGVIAGVALIDLECELVGGSFLDQIHFFLKIGDG